MNNCDIKRDIEIISKHLGKAIGVISKYPEGFIELKYFGDRATFIIHPEVALAHLKQSIDNQCTPSTTDTPS